MRAALFAVGCMPLLASVAIFIRHDSGQLVINIEPIIGCDFGDVHPEYPPHLSQSPIENSTFVRWEVVNGSGSFNIMLLHLVEKFTTSSPHRTKTSSQLRFRI